MRVKKSPTVTRVQAPTEAVERTKHARPRRPRRETVAPLSALAWTRAVEEGLRLRQRVTSISAGVGAPRRMASERPRRSLSRRQAFGFFAIVWRRSKGQFAVFAHSRSHAKLDLCRGGGGSHDSEMPRTKLWRNHCEREMPRSISHDGFDAKFNVEATVLQVSRDSRTRAAVEPSCTTTRATRADRGPQARVKNYFIQPRPTSEIQHDAAATNASKRSLKALIKPFFVSS